MSLKGKVALVTGASRGAGKGIALALGQEGAKVIVTGRSIPSQVTGGSPPDENIHKTAEMVTQRGGIGIPLQVDHTDESQVKALFKRIEKDWLNFGRLDILVNNAWGGNEMKIDQKPFWEQPMKHWDTMFDGGVKCHILSSKYAVPLMLKQKFGLIINTSFDDHGKYTQHFFYDLAKNAINRLSFGMGEELKETPITVLALSPGFMRTEKVLASAKNEQERDELMKITETTEYIGRAVVALAGDPNVKRKSGQVLVVADLAREYGFTDIDGRQPAPFHL